mgnify:CR=1 FL=1
MRRLAGGAKGDLRIWLMKYKKIRGRLEQPLISCKKIIDLSDQFYIHRI